VKLNHVRVGAAKWDRDGKGRGSQWAMLHPVSEGKGNDDNQSPLQDRAEKELRGSGAGAASQGSRESDPSLFPIEGAKEPRKQRNLLIIQSAKKGTQRKKHSDVKAHGQEGT